MKNLTLIALGAALSLTAAATAQTADTAGSSPARASASSLNGELPEVHHYVYLSELPQPADLMKDATANGLTITRLDRTADRVVVSYRYPNGSTGTVGYALLSAAGAQDRVANARMEVARRPTVVTQQPEVVYVEQPYRTRVVYSDPWDDLWLPLTLGVGIGWATTWHGGHHYHGGGWHGGYGHGGWHRR